MLHMLNLIFTLRCITINATRNPHNGILASDSGSIKVSQKENDFSCGDLSLLKQKHKMVSINFTFDKVFRVTNHGYRVPQISSGTG